METVGIYYRQSPVCIYQSHYTMIKKLSVNIVIFLALLLSNSTNVFSQKNDFVKVSDLKEISEKISDFSNSTNTLTSDFVQEKHLSVLDQAIISKGKFAYKKENKILWQYFAPINYTIAINNGKFYIKDEKKISKYDINSNPVFKQINKLILSSVKGDIVNSKEFDVEFFKNNNYYLAVLKPKDENVKKVIPKIKIFFNKTDFSVDVVEMIENSDDFTKITFSNKKKNQNLPDNVFNIK